ncbi:MAG: endosialidase [Lachnospiraceae bacterium]|nr:endosialidase [Lachnospiraceae bacterium]
MAVVKELLRAEANGSVSFGDYTLATKSKVEDFKHGEDVLKVKTFQEITRLEKNGMVLYESVPGTSVTDFTELDNGMKFKVEGPTDASITLGLADDTEYKVSVNGVSTGSVTSKMGGKVSLSVELAGAGEVEVMVKKA